MKFVQKLRAMLVSVYMFLRGCSTQRVVLVYVDSFDISKGLRTGQILRLVRKDNIGYTLSDGTRRHYVYRGQVEFL